MSIIIISITTLWAKQRAALGSFLQVFGDLRGHEVSGLLQVDTGIAGSLALLQPTISAQRQQDPMKAAATSSVTLVPQDHVLGLVGTHHCGPLPYVPGTELQQRAGSDQGASRNKCLNRARKTARPLARKPRGGMQDENSIRDKNGRRNARAQMRGNQVAQRTGKRSKQDCKMFWQQFGLGD